MEILLFSRQHCTNLFEDILVFNIVWVKNSIFFHSNLPANFKIK